VIATIETIHHLVTIVDILPVVVDTIALHPVVVGTVVGTVVGMVGMVGMVAPRLVAVTAAHLLVADIGPPPVDMGIAVVEDMEIAVVVEGGAMKRFRSWFGI